MASPQQPSTPRWPLPGQAAQRASSAWSSFWKSFGGWKPQSKIALGIGVGCSFILATCVVCSSLTVALGAALPPVPTSRSTDPTATTQQQVSVPGNPTATTATQTTATATASPSPSATTAKATPTKAPTKPPAPTKTPCASPCNPWGYNFMPGNYITNPPSTFCSYFACIQTFWDGKGYVMECQDAKFSKSGGIQGSCSQHGGNWRPLYSH
jgi:hypothetical protein